jgi:hypothetical protein
MAGFIRSKANRFRPETMRRAQAVNQIGQSLQSGDLTGAQKALRGGRRGRQP